MPRLRDLQIDEISFVTKGASGDAKRRPRVVFLKGHPKMSDKPTMGQRLKAMFSKQEDGDVAPRTQETMLQEIMDGLTPDLKDKLMLIIESIRNAAAPAAEPEPVAPDPVEVEQEMDEEEMRKLAKAFPAAAEAIKQMAASKDGERAEIQKLRKEHEELRKALDQRTADTYKAEIRKSLDEYLYVPGDLDDVARLVYSVGKQLDDKDQETLASILRATNGIVRKAQDARLFRERGSSMADDNRTADSKLTQVAKKMREQDKSLTEAQARAKAMREDPDLRAELNDTYHRGVRMGR